MPVKAVFFDAAGTLIGLSTSVGHGYAEVARTFDLPLDPARVDAAFRAAWKRAPPYNPGRPEPDDGRSWWAGIVRGVLDTTGFSGLPEDRFESFFDALYAHYARPEQWTPFPDALGVLERLHEKKSHRLAVLSNFDRRLYGILEGLGFRPFLDDIVISSEIGFSKPHPGIFSAACDRAGVLPEECLHAGDDPVLDWAGAQAAGFQVFPLDRRTATLEGLFEILK